jgi:hypothetical protein
MGNAASWIVNSVFFFLVFNRSRVAVPRIAHIHVTSHLEYHSEYRPAYSVGNASRRCCTALARVDEPAAVGLIPAAAATPSLPPLC